MLKNKSIGTIFIMVLLILGDTAPLVQAEDHDSFTTMNNEIPEYIKPWQGKISLRYQNLTSNKGYSFNSQTEVPAASTIKLPLALYVMKLADEGKLDLSEKMTYQNHHYYGGSGVIQDDPVGSTYSLDMLLEKAMVYSDNIAFIMLKEKVGQENFVAYLKGLGAAYAYPGGRNTTSADDLSLYAQELFRYSKQSANGKKLLQYLEHTVYNTTIPRGIKGKTIAHKVGMIPMNLIYNDTAIIFDTEPYALAVTTRGIDYETSQEVIAEIATIVDHHHERMVLQENENKLVQSQTKGGMQTDSSTTDYKIEQNSFYYFYLEKKIFGRFNNPYKYSWNGRNSSLHQQLISFQNSGIKKQLIDDKQNKTEDWNTSVAQLY